MANVTGVGNDGDGRVLRAASPSPAGTPCRCSRRTTSASTWARRLSRLGYGWILVNAAVEDAAGAVPARDAQAGLRAARHGRHRGRHGRRHVARRHHGATSSPRFAADPTSTRPDCAGRPACYIGDGGRSSRRRRTSCGSGSRCSAARWCRPAAVAPPPGSRCTSSPASPPASASAGIWARVTLAPAPALAQARDRPRRTRGLARHLPGPAPRRGGDGEHVMDTQRSRTTSPAPLPRTRRADAHALTRRHAAGRRRRRRSTPIRSAATPARAMGVLQGPEAPGPPLTASEVARRL